MITIDLEKICYVVIKAREYDVKVEPHGPHSGSGEADDGEVEILEDYADDPTLEELSSFLQALNYDELAELQALMWVGRGDYTKDEWAEVLAETKSLDPKRTPAYLIGTPLLSDYLEEGLSALGYSCEDYTIDRL